MEKYFVTQITKTNDSNIYAISTTVKDVLDDAKMLYHQILSSVYATKNIEHFIVNIVDKFGNIVIQEVKIPTETE